jgi:hypothetical protein
MKKNFLFLIFIIILISSCAKDEIKFDPDNPLIGIWDYSGQEENVTLFIRSRELSNSFCYRFNADGTLIERNISGFCGTPPVSYTNYQGNWTLLNDTLIKVDVIYYDGKRSYNLDIEAVDANTLKVVTITGTD